MRLNEKKKCGWWEIFNDVKFSHPDKTSCNMNMIKMIDDLKLLS